MGIWYGSYARISSPAVRALARGDAPPIVPEFERGKKVSEGCPGSRPVGRWPRSATGGISTGRGSSEIHGTQILADLNGEESARGRTDSTLIADERASTT